MIFYAGDGRIAGRDHKWVQYSLLVIVAMFQRMSLDTNLEKSKTMVCTPSTYRGGGGNMHTRDRRQ